MKNQPVGYDDVTWVFSVAGSEKQVTWGCGFKYDGTYPGPSTVAAEMYDASVTNSLAPFKASLMLVDWTFVGVSVSHMTSTGPLVGQHFVPITGTVAQATVPMNCSYLMRKSTALGGRSQRGRAYVPPVHVGESHIDGGGTIEAAFVTSVQSYMDQLFNDGLDIGDGDNAWYLYHTITDVTPPVTLIESWSVQSKIATQRRRLR